MATVVGHRAVPARLGWIRTGWELLLGYLCAAVLLLVPALLLGWLGVFAYNTGLRRPQRIVNAPYYPDGIWAVVADLAVGALVVVFVGLVVQGSVRQRTGYELPRWLLIATLGVTGWVPYLGFHLLPVSAGVSFLATLLVARYSARPALGATPARWPWPLLEGLFAVALVAAVSYAVFHPLGVDGYGGGSFSIVGGTSKPGVLIQVRNRGFADLTVLGLDAPARVGSPGLFPMGSLTPTRVRARHSLWLLLPVSVCRRGAVHVRYRVLGGVHSQPLLLPNSTGCTRS